MAELIEEKISKFGISVLFEFKRKVEAEESKTNPPIAPAAVFRFREKDNLWLK